MSRSPAEGSVDSLPSKGRHAQHGLGSKESSSVEMTQAGRRNCGGESRTSQSGQEPPVVVTLHLRAASSHLFFKSRLIDGRRPAVVVAACISKPAEADVSDLAALASIWRPELAATVNPKEQLMHWWKLALLRFASLAIKTLTAYRTPKSNNENYNSPPGEKEVLSQWNSARDVLVMPTADDGVIIIGATGSVLQLDSQVATELHRYLAPVIGCACACMARPELFRTNGAFDEAGPQLLLYRNDVVIVLDHARNALAFDRSACQKLHVSLRPGSCACQCRFVKAGKQQQEPELSLPARIGSRGRRRRVFVSYMHKVHDELAASVSDKLNKLGHDVWLDKVILHPYEANEVINLDETIADAIRRSDTLVILISTETFLTPRYAQREIRLAIALYETETNAPEIILISVDSRPPPTALSKLAKHVLVGVPSIQDLASSVGESAVGSSSTIAHTTQSVRRKGPSSTIPFPEAGVTPSISSENEEKLYNWNKFVGKHAHAFLHDIYLEVGQSAEEVELKQFLVANYERSARAIVERRFMDVRKIWAPIEGSHLFDPGSECCASSSLTRLLVLSAIADCFMASIFGAECQGKRGGTGVAIEFLERIVRCDPFSLRGAGRDNLAAHDARNANILLMDALEYALNWRAEWFDDNTVTIAEVAALDVGQVEELFRNVESRLGEVRGVLLGLESHQ